MQAQWRLTRPQLFLASGQPPVLGLLVFPAPDHCDPHPVDLPRRPLQLGVQAVHHDRATRPFVVDQGFGT
jgi:hypothetical protein